MWTRLSKSVVKGLLLVEWHTPLSQSQKRSQILPLNRSAVCFGWAVVFGRAVSSLCGNVQNKLYQAVKCRALPWPLRNWGFFSCCTVLISSTIVYCAIIIKGQTRCLTCIVFVGIVLFCFPMASRSTVCRKVMTFGTLIGDGLNSPLTNVWISQPNALKCYQHLLAQNRNDRLFLSASIIMII